MANFKTPGVYVQEIPTLPASIAPVATAIPGFVGYTEKAIIDGAQWNYANGPAPPVRITSLLEYEQIFGLPYHENYQVTLDDTDPKIIVTRTTTAALQNFTLHYQMQMFFANGGSVCWVVSAGDYDPGIAKPDLLAGLALLDPIDEVTLLLIPEAISLTASNRKDLHDSMLAQCAKLKDRFSIMDVKTTGNVNTDGSDFRTFDVGPDNLKYGAAYYPSLAAPLGYFYIDDEVVIDDQRSSPVYTTFPNNTLSAVNNGYMNNLVVDVNGDITAGKVFTINSVTFKSVASNPNFLLNEFDGVTGSTTTTAANFEAALKRANFSNLIINRDADKVGIKVVDFSAIVPFTSDFDNVTFSIASGSNLSGGDPSKSNKALYNSIKSQLNANKLTLYPGATMAGVYSRVDNERGVWQAPANVGVRFVNLPSVLVTAEEQENLNVDSLSGKSINAIRSFTGRGTIVWGARTLAGNDNEWRYINVRRLFLMIEESIQEATEFVVFEPNTANTWQRVKGMIEAFLTGLWRDGALAGAVPKDAFFVEVGLGTTMTSDDILNGIMNVRIGIAAVRPAEFIILKFSHKLQES